MEGLAVKDNFNDWIEEHQSALDTLRRKSPAVTEAVEICVASLKAKGCIFWAGNGGSAADAQHMAAELVGRFSKDRAPLRSIALSCNTSTLTAIANDYGYEKTFARQIEALGNKGDVLIAISTSGESPNIIAAVDQARDNGIKVIGLCGADNSRLGKSADLTISFPDFKTPIVQECHLLVEHFICSEIEKALFP